MKHFVMVAVLLVGACAQRQVAEAPAPPCDTGPTFDAYADCRIARIDAVLAIGNPDRSVAVAGPALVRFRESIQATRQALARRQITEEQAYEQVADGSRRARAEASAAQAMLPVEQRGGAVFVPTGPIYTPPPPIRNQTCYPVGRSVNCYSY